jgi:RHS repeat-associated protein
VQVQNGTNLVSTFIFNNRLQPCWMYATTGTALATSTTCTATDSTPGNILDLHYNFNLGSGDNGNVMGITNSRDTTRTQSFTYDQLNRIAAAQTSSTTGANCWGETYTLDQWANLLSIGAASGYTGCTQEGLSVSVGTNNQLTSTGISYDASGNVLGDGTNSYAWNAKSEIKTAAGVNYTYDGDGDRVEKSSGKIYWYGAGTEILDESDASGNFTDEYVFVGGKRIAMRNVSTGTIYYYAEDMLGSSRTIVQAGGTAPCYDADFYPFGGERAVTNTCAQNYKFEGKERDTETGNDDFGARYYSSRFGRWLSADWSSVPEAVPYANLSNPQTLNLYAMVSDNPETFADLDGHCRSQLGMPVDCGEISGMEGSEGGKDQDDQTVDRMRANTAQAAADAAAPNHDSGGFWQRVGNLLRNKGFKTNAEVINAERTWLTQNHIGRSDGTTIDWTNASPQQVAAAYGYMQRVDSAASWDHMLSVIGFAATVTFGHGSRHLEGTGLRQDVVEDAITEDVRATVRDTTNPTGSFRGRVDVAGQTIEYRAYTLPDGTIRVGTYYAPR